MSNCANCEHLKLEMLRGGKISARCFAPMTSPWGNGRVIDGPRLHLSEEKIERPRWCGKAKQ